MKASQVKRWADPPPPPPRRRADLLRYMAKQEKAREEALRNRQRK